VFEAVLVKELAEAEMLGCCWWRVRGILTDFIVTGVLVEEEDVCSSAAPGEFGKLSLTSSLVATLFLVAAPLPESKLAEPCSCSTSSSHLTLRDDDGRSARSARFKQSVVRSLSVTQIW
jgi:hypothetical protein